MSWLIGMRLEVKEGFLSYCLLAFSLKSILGYKRAFGLDLDEFLWIEEKLGGVVRVDIMVW